MGKHTATVDDEIELKGYCLVAQPDGTVVTAARSYRLTQPGKYTITYNAGGQDTYTVRRPKRAAAPVSVPEQEQEQEQEPEQEPEDSPQEAGHTDE